MHLPGTQHGGSYGAREAGVCRPQVKTKQHPPPAKPWLRKHQTQIRQKRRGLASDIDVRRACTLGFLTCVLKEAVKRAGNMYFFQAPYFAVQELEETVRHPAYPEEESVSTGPGPPSNSQREASGARGGRDCSEASLTLSCCLGGGNPERPRTYHRS